MKPATQATPAQLLKVRKRPIRGRTVVVVAVVALGLAALRCSVDVPLGVDPRSDAADENVDAGAAD